MSDSYCINLYGQIQHISNKTCSLKISYQSLNSKCSILDFRLHVFDIMCRGCKWHFDCMQNSERRSKNDSQEP